MIDILSVVLSALLPAGIDVVKTLLARITGIPKYEPKTVEEKIKLMEAETERLKVVAELDKPAGEISKWVANLRSANRYILGNLIIVITFIYLLLPGHNVEIASFLLNLTAVVFAFFFGDRVYMHLRKG